MIVYCNNVVYSVTILEMASRNSTCDCPVAQTANVLGMPWTALVLRDLLLKGVCRYQELLDSLKGIAPNTLSERLKMLESNGIVERRFYEQHPPRAEYVLTPKGRELGPIIRAMRDWGQKHGGGETQASLKPR
jgi:DNA-binding HxlR family transcriptional regulator